MRYLPLLMLALFFLAACDPAPVGPNTAAGAAKDTALAIQAERSASIATENARISATQMEQGRREREAAQVSTATAYASTAAANVAIAAAMSAQAQAEAAMAQVTVSAATQVSDLATQQAIVTSDAATQQAIAARREAEHDETMDGYAETTAKWIGIIIVSFVAIAFLIVLWALAKASNAAADRVRARADLEAAEVRRKDIIETQLGLFDRGTKQLVLRYTQQLPANTPSVTVLPPVPPLSDVRTSEPLRAEEVEPSGEPAQELITFLEDIARISIGGWGAIKIPPASELQSTLKIHPDTRQVLVNYFIRVGWVRTDNTGTYIVKGNLGDLVRWVREYPTHPIYG